MSLQSGLNSVELDEKTARHKNAPEKDCFQNILKNMCKNRESRPHK